MLPRQSPIAAFYRTRNFRPIWDENSAKVLVDTLAQATNDGLDPALFQTENLQSLLTDHDRAAEREIALSQAFVAYVQALHTPSQPARMTYIDAALAPQTDPVAILQAAASTSSPTDRLAAARRMHPLYERLRAALASFRSTGHNPSNLSDTDYQRLLSTNMDRLRALPADPGRRYVLVDTASARLWMFQDGRLHDAMRVVVGKQRLQTPALAGMIRFAMRNPYWNLPPDLARERAAKIVHNDPDLLKREHLEVLSGWDEHAQPVDPATVDWAAAASGAQKLRMRQLPGPSNMMGAVKFMMPNTLGIYLHDTPDKDAFARDDRWISSGCVRLEDAARFGDWLFGGSQPVNTGGSDDRADLPEPIAVYIVYLTALPGKAGPIVQRDRYARDIT